MVFGFEGNNNIEDSMLKTSIPLFFKIILPNTVRNGKLMIPQLFAKKYGNVLPRSLQLRVRTGETWQVKLETCGGEFWLKHGWKEFAEYYSLAFGHLLLFQYQGNSNFHVFIFDKTATEIEYPLGPGSKHSDRQPQDDGEFQDREVEEPEHVTSLETMVGVSYHLRKIPKKVSTGQANASKLHSPVPADDIESSDAAGGKKTNEVETINEMKGRELSSRKPLQVCKTEEPSVEILDNSSEPEEKKKPSQVVKIDKSAKLRQTVVKMNCKEQVNAAGPSNISSSPPRFDNPFFKVVLRSHHLEHSRLNVPSLIIKSMKHEVQMIKLRVGGRAWLVKLTRYQKNQGQILGGFRVFAKDNALQVGDTLAFAMIKANELLVSIFRNGS